MKLLEWSVDDGDILHVHIQPVERLGSTPNSIWMTRKLPKLYHTYLMCVSDEDIRRCIREVKHIEEFHNTGISVIECDREYVREFYTMQDRFNQQVVVNVNKGYWIVDRISYTLEWSSLLPLLRAIEKFFRRQLKCPALWIGGEENIYAFSPYPIKDTHCYFTLVDNKIFQRSLPIPVYQNGRWTAEVNVNDFSNLVGESFHEMAMRLDAKIDSLNELIT